MTPRKSIREITEETEMKSFNINMILIKESPCAGLLILESKVTTVLMAKV
jgi:hypothetical protein